MELPDVLVVEASSSLSGHGGSGGQEVRTLRDGVHQNHDRVVAMSLREFGDEVNTDHLPSALGDRERVELTNRAPSNDLGAEARLARAGVIVRGLPIPSLFMSFLHLLCISSMYLHWA